MRNIKIKVDLDLLEYLIPGVKKIEFLPRKKKKKYKKEIGVEIDKILDDGSLLEYLQSKKLENGQ